MTVDKSENKNTMIDRIGEWSESHLPGAIFWFVLVPPLFVFWYLRILVMWLVLPVPKFQDWKKTL